MHMAPARAYAFLALCFLVCVYSLPAEPKFRQMSLQAQKEDTSAEIEAISARITFLQKLNKLTYDTTLFTRKLRWLLRRSLTEKPSVAEVADLMNKELAISKAQIEVAVEGVADELRLEVKQGIIALKAGLAFIEDNYVAGSNPEADAIIAKIKANLAALEARFGQKFGETLPITGPVETSAASSTAPVTRPPEPSSTASAPTPAPAASSGSAPPSQESSTVATPPPAPAASSTVAPAPAPAASTAGSIIESGAGSSAPAPTPSTPAASSTVGVPPPHLISSSTGQNHSNETSSSTAEVAKGSLSTGGFF